MNICIATSNYYPDTGGISTYSQRLAYLLQLQGHKAIILTIDINSSTHEVDFIETNNKGITIVRLKKTFHHYYDHFQQYFLPGGMNAPYWIAMGRAMQDWLKLNGRKYKIDIIEASAFGGIGVFLVQNEIPPVLLSGHGAFFQYKQYNNNKEDEQGNLIEKLERLAFTYADGIISHSPQSRDDILQYTQQPVYLAKIPIILSDHLQEENQTTHESPFALVVGGLQKLKGPDILFKALQHEKLKEADFTIIWAGTDNYDQETGKRMSEKLKKDYPEIWNKKIIWEDTPDDTRLNELYNKAMFIIIPTLWESFNVIPIEAAFHQKPSVITNKTGSSFMFNHGKNAWIIPAGDENSLSEAIVYLFLSPDLCRDMGKAAFEEIALQLTPQRIITERINIYSEIIGQQKTDCNTPDLSFISNYTTVTRKLYFTFRKFVKKIAGK